MSLPKRKPLPHETPDWVKSGEVFFVTVCAECRGVNSLTQPVASSAVFTATDHYQFHLRWHVRLLLLMPDHLHMLASFPRAEEMRRTVTSWKHFLSKQHGIAWQRDFFDHRIRSHESLDEKAHYIRQNPVRAGLVADAGTWPYVWEPR